MHGINTKEGNGANGPYLGNENTKGARDKGVGGGAIEPH